MIFSREFSKFLELIIFRNISICVEKENTLKITWKPGMRPGEEDNPLPILY